MDTEPAAAVDPWAAPHIVVTTQLTMVHCQMAAWHPEVPIQESRRTRVHRTTTQSL